MSIGLEVDFTYHDMPTCHIMSVLFILFARVFIPDSAVCSSFHRYRQVCSFRECLC